MKHFQSKVLTAAILAALSGSAMAGTVTTYDTTEVDTKIKEAKTEVTTDLESKITAAKKDLETKLTAQNESGKKDIKEIKTAIADVAKVLVGEKDNDQNPGLIDTIDSLNKSVESNKSEIEKLTTNLAETDAAAKAATAKVTEVEKVANAALVNAYNNAQDINGFEAGDTLYDIGENGNITETKATEDDVKNDEFKGRGLRAVVAENSEALVKTAKVVNEISTDVKANTAALNTVSDKADKAVEAANAAKTKAEEAINTANETKQNVDTKVKAAKDAAGKAKDDADRADAAVVKAEAAAKKVTDIKEAAKAALDQANKNKQDINGFKEGDTIYKIDENGKITEGKATKDDVEADDFSGLGLKEVVAEHYKVLDELTNTVNNNSDELEKTIQTVNEHTDNLKAVKTAINENEDAIATNKADIATNKADIATNKADVAKNKADIAKKANSADVYTREESDSKFVKINDSIGGLNTTANELKTRLASAEKSVADLRKETRQGLAEQAALSGLFQPYNVGRFNVTAAVGGYKSESAVAIGTGFRFTENFAAKAGVAVGTSSGSSAAYHVGVNYEW